MKKRGNSNLSLEALLEVGRNQQRRIRGSCKWNRKKIKSVKLIKCIIKEEEPINSGLNVVER